MARTGIAVRRLGWENQTENLTVTHRAFGVAALALAEKARERAFPKSTNSDPGTKDRASAEGQEIIINDPTPEFELASIRDLQAQLARQNLAAREMRECIEALSGRAADADKRCAELQDELDVSRDEILLQQNDKHALQTSLESLARENTQLAHRLTESEVATKKARSQIEQAKEALNAAQIARKDLTAALDEVRQKSQSNSGNLEAAKLERTKLIAALDRAQQQYQTEISKLKVLGTERDKLAVDLTEANARHLAEISQLKSRLDDTTSRAEVAESILAKLRQILLQKFKMLQASLGSKDGEIHELEQSRTKLVDGTKMLLGIFEMRDRALIRADERIKFLTDRIAELEGELYPSRSWQKLKEPDDQAQSAPPTRERADASHRIDTMENWLDSNSEASFTISNDHIESARPCATEAMLTATITF